jgi:hypothetical protein
MTLNDIIVSALAQLDRGHDALSLDIWRDKLTRFANEAVTDLSFAAKARASEHLTLEDGALPLSSLSRKCTKVCAVKQFGRELAFSGGEDTGEIIVSGAREEAPISVTYRYCPRELSAPSDVPDLPEWCHGLIVCYVVGRERASGEVAIQRGGNVYFEMYEAGKAKLRSHYGGADSYSIRNRW